MELKFDLSKTYAVALEGGGARGAYQAGVWKALDEQGFKYNAVSGTSVGALNGAIMAMKRPDLSEEIWNNMDFSLVMKVDGRMMKTLFDRGLLEVEIKDLSANIKSFFREKGVDVTPLRSLISEKVDPASIKRSGVRLFVSTFSVSDRRGVDIEASALPEQELYDMLMASAYFPGFKNERMKGKRYADGGFANNVPISTLLNHGYKDILVLRLNSIGVEKRVKIPEGTTVTELAPNTDLGNMMNFSKAHCKRLFRLGYFDGQRLLFGLYGKKYYIDCTLSEDDAFGLLCEILMNSKEQDDLPENLRSLHREVLRFAKTLSPKGDYYDALIAYLEETAEKQKISEFKIYTDRELLSLVGFEG